MNLKVLTPQNSLSSQRQTNRDLGDLMLRILAVITELFVTIFVLWVLILLSTLLHEFGHAVGYMLATGDRHWHIRIGWGKRLLNTKPLTVNLLVFDGYFTPSEKKIDTKAKLIMTLLGGPVLSLLAVAGTAALKFGGFSFQSDFFADGVIAFFLNTAFSVNLFILVLSIVPFHYFHGEIKGLETDGLQIIHAVKRRGD